MRACQFCGQVVSPVKKKFSWLLFIFFLGVPYLVYRVICVRKNKCPLCGMKTVRVGNVR